MTTHNVSALHNLRHSILNTVSKAQDVVINIDDMTGGGQPGKIPTHGYFPQR